MPDRLSEEVAHTIRRLYGRGLVSGVGGNASVRLDDGAHILVTPSGYFKGGIASGDLVKVALDGNVVEGAGPSSELPTHLEAYRRRSDVMAVVHGHPPTAVGLITAGLDISPLTPEHAVMVRQLKVVDFATPGARGAAAVAPYLDGCDVVGIRNHGFFAFARTLHDAASKIEVLEESAKIYVAMAQVGDVRTLEPSTVAEIRRTYGRE
ncbi:MAG: class II aldolase/adducin family protein [Nitrososphaerota archaeon]|nr:class II aldolase/adducin family protein [Nitrososphaerota archaeon]